MSQRLNRQPHYPAVSPITQYDSVSIRDYNEVQRLLDQCTEKIETFRDGVRKTSDNIDKVKDTDKRLIEIWGNIGSD